MAAAKAIDTDDLILGRKFERDFFDECYEQDGCLMFPRGVVAVDRKGSAGGGVVPVQAGRVAWALAHPNDHLGRDECAIHTCPHPSSPANYMVPVCVTTAHLVKGSHKDRVVAMKMRALLERQAA